MHQFSRLAALQLFHYEIKFLHIQFGETHNLLTLPKYENVRIARPYSTIKRYQNSVQCKTLCNRLLINSEFFYIFPTILNFFP